MKGIDVSDCNGKIDWKKVKGAGVEFAVLRTTRKSGKADNYLAANIKGCRDNAIPFDFYKYSYCSTIQGAIDEAQTVIRVLKNCGVDPDKKITIYMDVEDPIQFKLSTYKLTSIILSWQKVVEEAGFTFGLYMGKYYYESGEVDTTKLPVPTWIARYCSTKSMKFSDDPDEKYKPKAKTGELKGWQYTSSGKVDGISGNVDLDIYYGNFKIADATVGKYIYDGMDFSDVFDPDFYANKYPDLKKAFGNDARKLFRHFIGYGMDEARQASAGFNVVAYKARYKDLQEAFKGDWKKYYIHFIQFGKKENRRAV